MAVFGIIAEYNPFHNGHLYQLQQIREFDKDASIIVAMSGNITQRGDFAILDKWQRAELAVKNGADLVLELPAVFVVRSAQYFACGGVSLFNSLNIVDYLSFGMEADKLSDLEEIVNLTSADSFDVNIKNYLADGLPYAAAVSEAVRQFGNNLHDNIKLPNNILAVEYLKALRHLKSPVKPFAIKRLQSRHNDTAVFSPFASSTAIRKAVHAGMINDVKSAVPEAVFSVLQSEAQNRNFPDYENIYRAFLTMTYSLTANDFRQLYGFNEGFENLLWDACHTSRSFAELISNVSTRRYPQTRIKRLLMTVLLQLSREQIEHLTAYGLQYYRVLAFSSRGQQLLHNIKKLSSKPIITKVSAVLNSHQLFTEPLDDLQQMLAIDVKATDLFNLARAKLKTTGEDFSHSPVVIK